jgi:hypothetical protein
MANYDDYDYVFEDLRLMDIEHLKKLVKAINEFESNDKETKIRLFFSYALLPYYEDVFWDGMKAEAGHIIYRISDLLPLEKRHCIEIYPSSHGSICINDHYWDSLEDWRKQWEVYNPVIPDFTRKIPSSLLELFSDRKE